MRDRLLGEEQRDEHHARIAGKAEPAGESLAGERPMQNREADEGHDRRLHEHLAHMAIFEVAELMRENRLDLLERMLL